LADWTGTKYLAKPIDGDENTPLHFAAIYGHHEIVETLLRAKPQPKKVKSSQFLGSGCSSAMADVCMKYWICITV